MTYRDLAVRAWQGPPCWRRSAPAATPTDARRHYGCTPRFPSGTATAPRSATSRYRPPTVTRSSTKYESYPLLVVLCTHHEGPDVELQAGQALENVWLTATARGLAASMTSEVVEVPETRDELRQLLGGTLHPQALLRIDTPDDLDPWECCHLETLLARENTAISRPGHATYRCRH